MTSDLSRRRNNEPEVQEAKNCVPLRAKSRLTSSRLTRFDYTTTMGAFVTEIVLNSDGAKDYQYYLDIADDERSKPPEQ
jgi:hypothetical protein